MDGIIWIVVAFCALMAGIAAYTAIAGRHRPDVWVVSVIACLGEIGMIAWLLWWFWE